MFSVDWTEWRKEWSAWMAEHGSDLKPTRKPFKGKNFLADEILGTFKINGRTVELSEVTFPNLSERDPQTGRLLDTRHRFVGVTIADNDGEQPLVSSFEELEAALGLKDASTA